jgi:hypothetical protein
VPKKTKSQSPTAPSTNATANSPVAAQTEPTKPVTKKPAAKAKSASSKAASKKKSARKTAASPKAKAVLKQASPGLSEPSDADIRLRAYFIAERRVQYALQGDPALDWIEARRQLLEEAQQPAS